MTFFRSLILCVFIGANMTVSDRHLTCSAGAFIEQKRRTGRLSSHLCLLFFFRLDKPLTLKTFEPRNPICQCSRKLFILSLFSQIEKAESGGVKGVGTGFKWARTRAP